MPGPTLRYLELFQKKDKSPENAEGRDEHAWDWLSHLWNREVFLVYSFISKKGRFF